MTETKRVRNLALLAVVGFAASFTLGACFNGLDSEGLPCDDNSQCAIGQLCSDGFCNGIFFCDDGTTIEAKDVCDEFPDCLGGEDEDPDLCSGDEGSESSEDQFECEGGTRIPLDSLCDGTPDCEDEEDELGCAGVDANMCGGSGGPDIAYEPTEAVDRPLTNPLPVVTLDIIGPSTPEIIMASEGGNMIDIVSFGSEGNVMPATLGPFENLSIVGFDTGDVNNDDLDDIIVATEGEDGFSTYVFQNDSPDPPIEYGAPQSVSLPGGIQPEVQAIKLARLNNDASIDLVAIVDSDVDIIGRGRLMVSIGDSASAGMGGAYFTPALIESVAPLDYDMFFDIAVGDFDPVSSLDDVLVSGIVGTTPTLWLISRLDEGAESWSAPTEIDGIVIPPVRLALGQFGPGMGPDLAVLDPMMGRMQTLRNMNGVWVTAETINFEVMTEGLTLSDINCDGRDDFLVYQSNHVAVYFGEGGGGVLNLDDPVEFELEGFGRGRLATGDYNADGAPDIVATMDGAVQIGASTGEIVLGED